MGSMKDSKLKVLDSKTTKEPITILGVNLSCNTYKFVEENYYAKIKNENKIEVKTLKRSHDIQQIFIGESFRYITISLCSNPANCF